MVRARDNIDQLGITMEELNELKAFDEDIGKLFRKRVREERLRQGITQMSLSVRIGLAYSFMSHLENGYRYPRLITLCKLADELDVSVDYLLGRTDKKRVND